MKNILFIMLCLLCSWSTGQANQGDSRPPLSTYDSIHSEYQRLSGSPKIKGYKQFKRWEQFWRGRIDTNGRPANAFNVLRSYNKFLRESKNTPTTLANEKWEDMGPRKAQTGNSRNCASGRISVIAFDPDSAGHIWGGSAWGGLWKTENNGKSWEVVPFTEILSAGISDIAISESNHDIIYAATGDADGGRFFGGYSLGIIKSTDRGRSWSFCGFDTYIDQGIFVNRVIVDPNNADIAYAGTSRNILKTTDGGASWQAVLDGEYFKDLEFHPKNSNIIYASSFELAGKAKIFKSDDAGATWYETKSFDTINRVQLSLSSSPDRVYALLSDYRRNKFAGILVSDDAGDSWREYVRSDTLYDAVAGQGFYNLVLIEDKSNPKKLMYGGVELGSLEIGADSTNWINPYIHVDFHDLKYSPHDGRLYLANDGGVFRQSDTSEAAWENLSSNLGITQFYKVSPNPLNKDILYAGAQDNNMFRYYYGDWQLIAEGDGMETIIDNFNTETFYPNFQVGHILRFRDNNLVEITPDTREGKAWMAPVQGNEKRPDVIMIGNTNVWRSYDQGDSWERISDFGTGATLRAMSLSQTDTNYIYAANNTYLYSSTNAGANWNNIYASRNEIMGVQAHPTAPEKVLVALGGYDSEMKVLEISKTKIKNLTYNLPNCPVNAIVYDSASKQTYVGTDLGMFALADGSQAWTILGNGLPPIIVNDIKLSASTGYLYAATFGRGLWRLKIRDNHSVVPEIYAIGKTSFCSGDSVEVRVKDYPAGYKLKWSTGDTARSIIVKSAGLVYAALSDSAGLVRSSEPIMIKKFLKPSGMLQLLSRNPVCVGDRAVLKAISSLDSVRYVWSNGDTASTAYFTKAGDYYATIITQDSCTCQTDTASIKFVNNPLQPIISREGDWLTSTQAEIYEWYLNGKQIENGYEKSIKIERPGTYTVLVRDGNYCNNTSEPFKVFGDADTVQSVQINIYPNPVKNILNFDIYTKIKSKKTYKIYDAVGKEVSAGEIPDTSTFTTTSVDCSGIAQGQYCLEVISGNIHERVIFNIMK